jgi:tRNA dimethylallyltransferase
MRKPKILCVAGPTATGKTALGVYMCRRFDGEVISCDSMQIYKGMDILSAKPSDEEMQGIPHHLMGVRDIREPYSAALFVSDAKKCADDIIARGKVPVLVGGTGLYYNSFIDNIKFLPDSKDPEIRRELNERAEREGIDGLFAQLCDTDPETAAKIGKSNPSRVLRALEIFLATGTTQSRQNELSKSEPPVFDHFTAGLKCADRKVLYDRCDARVDKMFVQGLENEVRAVPELDRSSTAAQAIGYKELLPFINGNMSRDEASSLLKKSTRHYAKRQLTWFLRRTDITWYDIDGYSSFSELEKDAGDAAEKFLKGDEVQ